MDDYMPRSKDRSRGELEKLRGLPFKDKLWYIWNYYNYHIIAAVIAIVLIAGGIRSAVFTPDTALSVVWDAPYVDDAALADITDFLNMRLFEPDENLIADVSRFFTVSGDPQAMMQQEERLVAMISAGAIDIFILDYQTLSEYSAMEFLMPLDDILAAVNTESPQVFDALTDNLITEMYGFDLDDATLQTVGIRISDTPLLQSFDAALSEDTYLCVSITASNLYFTVQAIIALFSESP